MYEVVAQEQALADGRDPAEAVHALAGTTQNDIIKEYLSRGTYVSRPALAAADHGHGRPHGLRPPRWNPINICSYHLQEAGPRRCRRSPTRCAPRSPSSTRCATRGRCRRSASARWSRGSRSSSTPACASWRRCARCGPSSSSGTTSPCGVQDAKQRRFRVRRAGQLPRPHRGAAREQRAAHRPGDARDAEQGRPRTGRAAARVERGARPPAAVGPAVVPAHAAGARLRVRPLGVRRPLPGSAVVEAKVASLVEGARATGSRRWGERCRPSRAAT